MTAISTNAASARTSVWTFFGLAYSWTWAAWIPAALAERGTITLPIPVLALYILGGLGPMASAITVAARRDGGHGVRALFRQLRLGGLRRRWLVVAAGIGLLDALPAAVYVAGSGALPPHIGAQVAVMPFHFLFVAIIGGGLDEEMGWRGFALPYLQSRWNPLVANLGLGSLWACWHLPLWLVPDSSHAATPFAVYAVTVVAQSFLISWLYNASGASLLVAVVAHSSADVFDGLRLAVIDDPGWGMQANLLQMTAMVAAAVTLLVATRGRLGMRPHAVTVPASTPTTPDPMPARTREGVARQASV